MKLLNFYIVFGMIMMAFTSVFMIIKGENEIYRSQILWLGFIIFGLREIRMEHKKTKNDHKIE